MEMGWNGREWEHRILYLQLLPQTRFLKIIIFISLEIIFYRNLILLCRNSDGWRSGKGGGEEGGGGGGKVNGSSGFCISSCSPKQLLFF